MELSAVYQEVLREKQNDIFTIVDIILSHWKSHSMKNQGIEIQSLPTLACEIPYMINIFS